MIEYFHSLVGILRILLIANLPYSELTSHAAKQSFSIQTEMNCDSSNLIYMIKFASCGRWRNDHYDIDLTTTYMILTMRENLS